jgi:hypothetical protein
MLPLRMRRSISFLLNIGIKWSERHGDILARVRNGEEMKIYIDFETVVDGDAATLTPAISNPVENTEPGA